MKKLKVKLYKPEFDNTKMVVPIYSSETLDDVVGYMEQGNIPATLKIIMHNQKIISEKLDKLLKV